ncbi:hypothetical protein QBC34DRAFT_364460 [Podospora aff. communis PSN243]|uniref:F-box domain-containing protein n=1 Tax=Podospora aff. communis PSN243 TaxID=3040156 RepID=A0AAV9G0E5_9PEZI|nr:hypothetical protein QBC34DRAFT_364460 [Podospora aff. communis PSN243]
MQLPDLPVELIEQTAHFLDIPSLLNLRLTSQQLRQKSFPAFATACFSTVHIDLCPEPLARLQRIAQHPVLRLHVHRIVLAELRYPTRCSNPPRHRPGTGHHWTRNPRTNCLDPSPSANPAIADLRAALSQFPNLRAVVVYDDLAPEPEPPQPDASSLCLLDAIHIALLSIAHVPAGLRSFRVARGSLTHMAVHDDLLPRALLNSMPTSWATHLVDLQLGCYPPRVEASTMAPLLAELVLRARSLRRLSVHGARVDFYTRLLAGAAGKRNPPPPLEILEMQFTRTVTPGVMRDLVLRFKSTLRHLYVLHAALEGDDDWPPVLGAWAGGLGKLQSFNIQGLTSCAGTDGRKGSLVFDRVLQWEGSQNQEEEDWVPIDGEMTFGTGTVGPKKMGVVGMSYSESSNCEGRDWERTDAQKVLAKMAQVAYVECKNPRCEVGDTGRRESKQLLDSYVVGGRLKATVSRNFEAPDLPGFW